MYIAIPVVFGVLLLLASLSRRRSQRRDPLSAGRALALKFIDLGNLRGKTATEIIGAVGSPSSRSSSGGDSLLQWQAPGYHVAMKFDSAGNFVAITHESHQFGQGK
jgi:hypothetical protein